MKRESHDAIAGCCRFAQWHSPVSISMRGIYKLSILSLPGIWEIWGAAGISPIKPNLHNIVGKKHIPHSTSLICPVKSIWRRLHCFLKVFSTSIKWRVQCRICHRVRTSHRGGAKLTRYGDLGADSNSSVHQRMALNHFLVSVSTFENELRDENNEEQAEVLKDTTVVVCLSQSLGPIPGVDTVQTWGSASAAEDTKVSKH